MRNCAIILQHSIRSELKNLATVAVCIPPPSLESMSTFRDSRPLLLDTECDHVLRKKLVYQSHYRGMVEMDILLGHFADEKLFQMDRKQLVEYDTLLRQFDNDLFRWLVSKQVPPNEITSLSVWEELMSFVENITEKNLTN